VTEAELKAHRAERRSADAIAADLEADRDAWGMDGSVAIEIVERHEALARGDLRNLIAEMVALRIAGHTIKEIGEITGVCRNSVGRYLARAAETAERNDVGMLLDYHAVPLAVDNLLEGLRNGNEKYTLKVLEGRGHFQKHTKGVVAGTMKGGLVFEWKGAPQSAPALPEGAIQGLARGETVVEAEVVEDDK
jgi:predicted transcriptional regulator